MSKKSIVVTLISSLVIGSCSYSNRNIINTSDDMDTCLRHAIHVAAELNELKILGITTGKGDTSEIISSLCRIYKDTIIKRLKSNQALTVTVSNLGNFKFYEYLLTDDYYKFLKSTDSLWSVSKIEGYFYFKNDTGNVSKPNTYILKGPPVILICDYGDSSKYKERQLFMLTVVKHINNCRGTDKW